MSNNELKTLLSDVIEGHRLTVDEAVMLYKIRGRDLFSLFSAADIMREKRTGNTVTFVRNQNIHVTNICKNLCGFCGFGRPKSSPEAYLCSPSLINTQLLNAKERKVSEICFLSGVNPDFTIDTYLSLLKQAHDVMPDVHIHAFSPDEISHITSKGLTSEEAIKVLMKGGLGSMQGTAAEILVDSVRKVICPAKIKTQNWIDIIKTAHKSGLKSTATMMYGSVEKFSDRAAHLEIIRGIQDETHGFTEMVHLPFVHYNTRLHTEGTVKFGSTGVDDLVTTAVSRLFLDNFTHIQVSWTKMGIKHTQMGLMCGADDLSGLMYIDDVTSDAGILPDFITTDAMLYITKDIGRCLKERNTLYKLI